MLKLRVRCTKFTSLLLIFLLICNAFILHAQPKFINEAQGISGYNFSDVASFFLLLGMGECFLSLGGFLGATCFSMLLCTAIIDVFYLALPLKIVFDDTLLAFTDRTSLNGYIFYAFPLLFLVSSLGGILLKKNLTRKYKPLLFWISLTCLLGFISLFSGKHSALDKWDFLSWHKRTAAEISSKNTENGEFNLLTGKWAHKLRDAWGGLAGDLAFILTSAISPETTLSYHGERHFPQSLKKAKPISNADDILLIMGESSNPQHYALYGYTLPTTPYLSKLEEKHLACHLNQAHSTANNTRYAVLPSVSFWQPQNKSIMTETYPIMTLAAKAGFKTYWLSKQIENNFYAGFIGYNVESAQNLVTPNESHGIYTYENTHRLSQWQNSDEDLLPLLDLGLSEKGSPHFIAIHLIGNHIPYRNKSNQEDLQALPNASWYDRSIHAVDRLLYKIYLQATAQSPNALIFYISDHGEDLKHGGHSTAYGQLQYQIPLIFIGKNAKKWCDEAQKFRQKNGWYSSLANNLLISKILGYQVKSDFIKKRKENDEILLPNGKAGIWEEIPKYPPKHD